MKKANEIYISIHNEAIIKGNGEHIHKNCKPVICIDNGNVYTSVFDAADSVGVNRGQMSNHLRGRTKTIKGKHFCYLSQSAESLDAIVTRLREISVMEMDAQKWRKHQAEQKAKEEAEAKRQEAIRKAKEDHAKAITKAREKVARLEVEVERRKAKLKLAEDKLMAAQIELEALMDEEV